MIARMMTARTRRPRWAWIAAAVAVVFGVLTVIAGGRVLFGGAAARAAAGDVVPFVLWFNFAAGFVYVAAGLGIALWRPWGRWLALLLAAATLVVFAAFTAHAAAGGAFEARTVAAMTLRSAVWIALAIASWHAMPSRPRG
jgi:hypothetical protein